VRQAFPPLKRRERGYRYEFEQGILGSLGCQRYRPRAAYQRLDLRAAHKALPKAPPVRFEEKGEGDEKVTVLRVQRGGKGAPLVVNQHAARLLVEQVDALRAFAESGEEQELSAQEPQEEGDESEPDEEGDGEE